MKRMQLLKNEIANTPLNGKSAVQYFMYLGFSEHFDDEVPVARAYAIESLFTRHLPYVYNSDLIVGSIRGKMSDDPELTDAMLSRASSVVGSYGSRHFWTNSDHFAADYKTFLEDGVGGTLEKIERSKNCPRTRTLKRAHLPARRRNLRCGHSAKLIFRYGEAAGPSR